MTRNPLYFLEIGLGLKIILSNQTIYLFKARNRGTRSTSLIDRPGIFITFHGFRFSDTLIVDFKTKCRLGSE